MTGAPRVERVVGVPGVAFAAFSCIVGVGIFCLPELVAGVLGPAAIIAYLVCAVLIGLIGLCFAEAGSRVDGSGGLTVAGMLLLYLIVCLGVVRLRARGIAQAGVPFIAPGGPLVPIAAAGVILWLRSTLAWREPMAGGIFVAVMAAIFAVRETMRLGSPQIPFADVAGQRQ